MHAALQKTDARHLRGNCSGSPCGGDIRLPLKPVCMGPASTPTRCTQLTDSKTRFSRTILVSAAILRLCSSPARQGIQVGFGVLDEAASGALRDRASSAAMYLEGIVALPRDQAGLELI